VLFYLNRVKSIHLELNILFFKINNQFFLNPSLKRFVKYAEYTSSESPQMDHQTESVLKPTRSFKSSKSESFIENLNAIDFEYELGYSFKQIQEDLLSEMILLLISKG